MANSLIPAPPQQAPLSQYNTYTTWPGGIDPTASVFRTDNQKFGGKRKTRKGRKNAKKTRKNKNSRR